jgi:hypothetical protein
MGLRSLSLEPEYRTDVNNIVDDFYVPCLSSSISYSRAVGYFTGSGLAVAARGLSEFLKGDGHMRLVASPYLNESDIAEVERGYLLRSEAMEQAIGRELDYLLNKKLDPATAQRISSLAWLIGASRLEIKIAIPSDDAGQGPNGIYHEKIGLFEDSNRDMVAFGGSANETAGGLINNFEAIDVFWSWDDPQERVSRKVANFERLWTNSTNFLQVLDFPEAAKQKLLQMRPAQPPEIDPESSQRRHLDTSPNDPLKPSKRTFAIPQSLELYPHQTEAVEAWMSGKDTQGNVELAGFLEMATGACRRKRQGLSFGFPLARL